MTDIQNIPDAIDAYLKGTLIENLALLH